MALQADKLLTQEAVQFTIENRLLRKCLLKLNQPSKSNLLFKNIKFLM